MQAADFLFNLKIKKTQLLLEIKKLFIMKKETHRILYMHVKAAPVYTIWSEGRGVRVELSVVWLCLFTNDMITSSVYARVCRNIVASSSICRDMNHQNTCH